MQVMGIDKVVQTAGALSNAYINIWHQHMHDVPIINPKLNVETVDLQEWESFYLGVLITPWFMNLVLIPQEQSEWSNSISGEKFSYVFDAGEFEFILGHIEGIGYLLSCSLFSPMFEFEEHAAAVATAQAVMTAIFDNENQDSDQGQPFHPVESEVPTSTVNTQALSRRDFFRGKFLPSSKSTSRNRDN